MDIAVLLQANHCKLTKKSLMQGMSGGAWLHGTGPVNSALLDLTIPVNLTFVIQLFSAVVDSLFALQHNQEMMFKTGKRL